jgi:hypothetical protein
LRAIELRQIETGIAALERPRKETLHEYSEHDAGLYTICGNTEVTIHRNQPRAIVDRLKPELRALNFLISPEWSKRDIHRIT